MKRALSRTNHARTSNQHNRVTTGFQMASGLCDPPDVSGQDIAPLTYLSAKCTLIIAILSAPLTCYISTLSRRSNPHSAYNSNAIPQKYLEPLLQQGSDQRKHPVDSGVVQPTVKLMHSIISDLSYMQADRRSRQYLRSVHT